MNLLESAGFSRSNPYYIVKQGKVIKLLYIYIYEALLYGFQPPVSRGRSLDFECRQFKK
jgi:hypothetical protein